MLVLMGVFWRWWFPGPRVATDFSLISSALLKSQLNVPQTWSVGGTEGLGEYTVFTLWSWPFNFLQGILANLNISVELMQRILFILPFLFIGGGGVWKFTKRLGLSSFAKIISTLFYLTNTYILLLIDGGQLSISLAYAFFPWAFILLEQSLYDNLKKRVLAGLIIFGIGVFDIRFIYIFSLLCLIRFLYEFLFIPKNKWKQWFFSWIKTGFIIGIIIFGLNAYWILVLIKYPISSNFYQYLTQTSFTSFISLSHASLLLSPHWYKNVFGQISNLHFEFIFIPILVFLAPILKLKNKIVGFWLLVALLSMFLVKGSSEPLGEIYQWFYYNIPGFSLFRDSSKFFFLLALSYSVLIGITVDEILKRINIPKLRISFFVTTIIYFIFLVHPVWLGWMTGTFSKPILQEAYADLNRFINADKRESNIFWIPTIAPMTELSLHHPAVEATRLMQKRPFAQANIGTYETFNFLREASYMGQLFDIANIGYIAYPPLDFRRANPHPDNIKYYNTFLNQLSNLPWLSRMLGLQIPLLKVNKYQDKFFISPNTWWIVGSDEIYNEATKSSDLRLAKNALIFAEESVGLGDRLSEYSGSKIVLYNKTLIDLSANFINEAYLVFPARDLKHEPNTSGWWKRDTSDLIIWKDFLKTKYGIINQDFDLGGGWAVGEGNLSLRVKSSKLKKDDVLLARVMESSRSGQIKFYQGNKLIGKIDTISAGSNVRWFEIGSLFKDNEIKIESTGDINVVNAVTSLPSGFWSNLKNKSIKLQDRIVDFNDKGTEKEVATLSYKQVSPTKYTIYISNLKKPSMLVFSQNFDKNWKLNNQSSFPIYSLLNGYTVEKDGVYNLEFEAQKNITYGLVISIITLFTSIVLLLV